MSQIDRDDIPGLLVECEKRRRLATPDRFTPTQLAQETLVDELADEAGDGGAGKTGASGDLGPAGSSLPRDQLQRGAQICLTRVVFGRLGVPYGGVAVRDLPPSMKVYLTYKLGTVAVNRFLAAVDRSTWLSVRRYRCSPATGRAQTCGPCLRRHDRGHGHLKRTSCPLVQPERLHRYRGPDRGSGSLSRPVARSVVGPHRSRPTARTQ